MIALFAIALRGRWHDMTDSVEQLSWWVLVIATVLGFGIIFTSMMAWRTLLRDLESPLPIHSASRIFFLGQLGKYLPGSVWTVVVQAELGRDYKIPPRRTVAASVVSMGIALGAGLMHRRVHLAVRLARRGGALLVGAVPLAAGGRRAAAEQRRLPHAFAAEGFAPRAARPRIHLAGRRPRPGGQVIGWGRSARRRTCCVSRCMRPLAARSCSPSAARR